MSDSTDQAAMNPSQREAQISAFDLDEMQINRFRGVLRVIKLEAIPAYASNVRQFGHHPTNVISSETYRNSGSIPCKIIDLPLCGSYHIVFTLEFDDGIKWMLKISANGHRFDSVASAALISEARTMQLIKTETTIPVPAVYAFDASSHNELNVPFILMERIDGQPLYQRWFDDEIPKPSLEHFRIKTLQNLAEAMAQLNKFTMDRGGALEFDCNGRPVGLGGAKVVDAVATWNRVTGSEDQSEADQGSANNHKQIDSQDQCHGNNKTTDKPNQKTIRDRQEKIEESEQDITNNGDDDEEDIICEKGPFECPKSAFMFNLDRPNTYSESSAYIEGCYKALRMFIDLAFSNSDNRGRRFVLTHPDLDVQNILVAEDGTLRGLIDWDGVASVPREVGCAQYPLWLMRDWVPFHYLYDIRERRPDDDAGYEESSPAELASYRALYAHFMEKETARQTGGPDQLTAFGTLPKQEAQLTRRSLVMRDLDFAASSPFLLPNILCHIFYEIEKVTRPEWRYLDLDMDSCSDSSSSRQITVNSDRDSNNGTNLRYSDDPDPQATECVHQLSHSTAAAPLLQQDNEGAATAERLLSQEVIKIIDSSLRVPHLDQGPLGSLTGCQVECQDIKTDGSFNTAANTDRSSKPAHLSWGRKLLCFGCNAAEKSLRRIAKIGHVVENAVEEVAEVLAKIEIQRPDDTKLPSEGKLTIDHPQSSQEASDPPEKERPEDEISSQGIAELEQSSYSNIDAIETFGQLLSAQDKSEPQRTSEIASIQPNITIQGIPARKAELIKAEKAKNKAEYRAEKAAIKEELKVWTDIALLVSARGKSLEKLRMNKLKIARWVVDTLKAEEEQAGELVVDSGISLADGVGEQVAILPEKKQKELQSKEDMHQIPESKADLQSAITNAEAGIFIKPKLPRKEVRKGSSGRPAVTNTSVSVSLAKEHKDDPKSPIARASPPQSQCGLFLPQKSHTSKPKGFRTAKTNIVTAEDGKASTGFRNDGSSSLNTPPQPSLANNKFLTNEPGSPHKVDQSDGKSINPGKTVNVSDQAARAATGMNATPPVLSESRAEVLQVKNVSGSLKALGSFGASCLKKMFSSNSQPEDDKGSVKSDSSKDDGDNTAGDRSDTGRCCSSSTTSPDDEEVVPGEIAEAKDEEADILGTSVAPAERYGNSNKDTCEDFETMREMKKLGSHEQSALAGDLSKKNGSMKPRSRRRVHKTCSEVSVGPSKTEKSPTSGETAGANGEKGGADRIPTPDCNKDSDAKGDDIADHAPQNDHHSDAATDGEDSDDDARTFRDNGEFRSENIFTLLGMDTLDELRLLRLQEGFLKVLELY